MKRVININFQGRVIPIEESAYDVLKQYVESLRRHFANEEGRDEIINDIEGRVAELFGETLKKGATCIADDDVNKIIDSMGRPEGFEGEEASVKQQLGGEQKQQQNTSSNYSQQQQSYAQAEGPRRLYRDENHKVLGGVCSGLANYFNIDITVARVLFVIFFGVTFIPYLILWVAVPSSSTTVIGGQRKRLFRDGEDKVIAGVCSGLSQYFGVSVWIPRLLFLIPFFSFVFRWGHWGVWDFPHFLNVTLSPGSIFVYVILWLVLPEAKTTADKLEMKGEKVDLNNIKNTIQNDMEGFGQRAKKWGEEMGQKATEFGATVGQKGAEMGRDAANFTKRNRTTFGDVIVLLFKIFAYFIIGCALFGIVAGLFAAGVALTGLMPAFGYVISDGWQTVFLWGTVVLFIWIPVIGIVTFIIRRLAKMRGSSGVIRYSFLALWLIGLFCFIGLLSSLHDDFKYRNNATEETISLINPSTPKLEVRIEPVAKYYHYDWFKIEPFASLDEDTVFVRNIRVRIVRSRTDSFQVKMVRLSNGRSKQQADELVSKIDFDATQMDSILMLSKGIAINKKDKFRNQHVVLTIAVPVGKRIMIHEGVGWDHNVQLGFNDYGDWWEMDREDGAYRWDHNTEYIMTDKGLERTHKRRSRRDDDNDDSRDDAVEDFNKQKEELQKAKEKKQKELDEIDKALNKPVDSTRYKYTPEKPKKAGSTVPKTTTQVEANIGMNNLLMMRFPL